MRGGLLAVAERVEDRCLLSVVQPLGESAIPLGGALYTSPLGRQVVADSQGNLLAVWMSQQTNTAWVQSFRADGSARSAPTNTGNWGWQHNAAVSGDGSAFVLTWWGATNTGPSGGSNYVRARVFGIRPVAPDPATGADVAIGLERPYFTVAQKTPPNNNIMPVAAMDHDGDFVVAWQAPGGREDTDVFARRYDETGAQVGKQFQVNAVGGDQGNVSVAMDRRPGAEGNFVVSYDTSGGQDFADGGSGVYAAVFRGGTRVRRTDTLVNQTTAGSQRNAEVAVGPDGGFVAAWQGPDGDGDGVYARRFNADGVALGGEVLVNEGAAGGQFGAAVDVGAGGEFVVGWADGGSASRQAGVWAQAFAADGTRISYGAEGAAGNFFVSGGDRVSVACQAGGEFVVAANSAADATFGRRFGITEVLLAGG